MVKLSVCTWGTGDWYFFYLIVIEMKKGSIHILCEHFCLWCSSSNVQQHCHSSSQVHSFHFVLYAMYSLHYFAIICGECYHKQQGWGSHSRVAEDPKCSWDALLHFWASRHSITSQKTWVLLPVPHSQVFQLTQDPVLVWVHFYYVFQVIHKY